MNSNSFSILNRRQIGLFVAAGALLLALVLPTIAGAAQLTARSVALSSSSADADNVTYSINFTAATAAGAFVVDFCGDSPLVGTTCTPPVGLLATGADASEASTTAGVTDVTGSTSKVVVTKPIAVNDQVSVEITGINNPTAAGTMYARVVTYDNATNATAYTSTALGTGNKDDGGAAIAITNSIGVSAAVLETMSFCVSSSAINDSCGNAALSGLKLGEIVSDNVRALDATKLSTGDIYTQISTNAVSGAVVNLKSNALACGGLVRFGGPANCDITPVKIADSAAFLAGGLAKFGVIASAATNGGSAAGDYQPVATSSYGPTDYFMNYIEGDLTGVTSPYGDPFLDTAGKPVNNKNVKLTFGASISNNTPAGLYKADLGLIATGKF